MGAPCALLPPPASRGISLPGHMRSATPWALYGVVGSSHWGISSICSLYPLQVLLHLAIPLPSPQSFKGSVVLPGFQTYAGFNVQPWQGLEVHAFRIMHSKYFSRGCRLILTPSEEYQERKARELQQMSSSKWLGVQSVMKTKLLAGSCRTVIQSELPVRLAKCPMANRSVKEPLVTSNCQLLLVVVG